MTRSKNRSARRATTRPSAGAGRGTGPRDVPGNGLLPGTATSEPARDPEELPALGMAVASPWGWRIMAVVTMVALGLCITFFLDGHTVFGFLWVVITVAWGFFANQLRLRHLAWARS